MTRGWIGSLALCALGLSALPVAQAAEYQATLEWGRRVELATPLTGVVAEVLAAVGQRVEAGTLLVRLDDQAIQAQLARAQAEAKRAGLAEAEAKRELTRAQDLYDRTLLSGHEREVAELEAATARAAHQQAQAALARAEQELAWSRIQAPFAGRVIRIDAELGQTLVGTLRAETVAVLADDTRMRARLLLSAEEAGQIAPGAKARVVLRNGEVAGVLETIALEPEPGVEVRYAAVVGFEPPAGVTLRARETVRVVLE